MQLKKMQQHFWNQIVHGENSDELLQEITSFNDLEPMQQLKIYSNSALGCLAKSLQQVFPVITALVGEEYFRYLVREMAQSKAPQVPDLALYAKLLPGFIKNFAPLVSYGYLKDMATLEMAIYEVECLPTPEAFNFAALGRVALEDQENLKWQLSPNIRVIDSDYPIMKIWQANQPGYTGDEKIDLAGGGVTVVVYKNEAEVLIDRIDSHQLGLIKLLEKSKSLKEICEVLGDDGKLEQLIPQFIGKQWVVDFIL